MKCNDYEDEALHEYSIDKQVVGVNCISCVVSLYEFPIGIHFPNENICIVEEED